HSQDVADRDQARQRRFGVAPSLALGMGTPTRLTASYFEQSASDVPDYGIPWVGTRPADVPRNTFYGFSSDSLKTDAHVATVKLEHDVTDAITVRDTARYAHYARNFRISEPVITQPVSTPLDQQMVGFNEWSGDSTETMAWNQLEGVAHFATGPVQHAVVAGVEGGRETSDPTFDNSTGLATVSLLNPDTSRLFNATATFPRLAANTTAWSVAPYAIETASIEHWEASAGIRYDYFKSHYTADRYSTMNLGAIDSKDDVERTDKAPSYRAALVYKPEIPGANSSIYVAAGTSFNPSAETLSQITSGRSLGVSNKDLAPEKNRSYEFGTKWDVLDNQLTLTGAFFRITKENARVADVNNPGFNILAGEQRVDGFSAGATGHILPAWQVSAAYTYLDGEVTESVMGTAPVGSPLPNTPKSTFAAFTSYRVGRYEVGAGTQHTSGRYAQNTAPLRAVPGYTTFDAMARGMLSKKLALQLNVVNLTDVRYYDQLHPFHVVPGAGRTALLSLDVAY
ncbi:MAG TPA: TonB-dependent receptor, partial [Kofleriaceae bacterium]